MASLIELRLPTEHTCSLTSVSAAPRLRRHPPRGGFISGPAESVPPPHGPRRTLSMSTSFNSAGFHPEPQPDPGAPKIYGHDLQEQEGGTSSGRLIETKRNTWFRRVLLFSLRRRNRHRLVAKSPPPPKRWDNQRERESFPCCQTPACFKNNEHLPEPSRREHLVWVLTGVSDRLLCINSSCRY